MMNLPRALRSATVAALLILAACGKASAPASLDAAPGLAFPPTAVPRASAAALDPVIQPGSDYIASGGNVETVGETAALTPALPFSYALYGLSGFGELLHPEGITISTTAAADTTWYVGIADYSLGRWNWNPASGQSFELTLGDPARTISPGGSFHLAIAAGSASFAVTSVEFRRNTVPPPGPSGLTALATLEDVSLEWEPVELAEGYNIYRSHNAAFASPVKLNAVPVSGTEYLDEEVFALQMYYYRVHAAAGGEESVPSNLADAFVPQVDLPAPGNLRLVSTTPDSATLAWDWSGGADIGGFRVYVQTYPNFDLSGIMFDETYCPPPVRSVTVGGLEPGLTYYCRVCALDSSIKLGRLTDDLAFSAGGWQWGPVEVIGVGQAPVASCIGTDGRLAGSYFSGPDLWMAERSPEGVWSAGATALTEELETWVDDGKVRPRGFQEYQDIAFGNGEYLVIGYSTSTQDLWGSIGLPGDWTSEKIIGDTEQFTVHSRSQGMLCSAAADAEQYAVVYSSIGLNSGISCFRKSNLGSEWEPRTTNLRQIMGPTQAGLTLKDGNVYACAPIFGTGSAGMYWIWHLMSSDAENAYTSHEPHLQEGPSQFGVYTSMVNYGDGLMIVGRDSAESDLYAAVGQPGALSLTAIDTKAGCGWYNRVCVDGDKAFVLQYNMEQQRYHFCYFDGAAWITQLLGLPSGTAAMVADCEFIDGEPWVVYADTVDGMVKAAKGTPVV